MKLKLSKYHLQRLEDNYYYGREQFEEDIKGFLSSAAKRKLIFAERKDKGLVQVTEITSYGLHWFSHFVFVLCGKRANDYLELRFSGANDAYYDILLYLQQIGAITEKRRNILLKLKLNVL